MRELDLEWTEFDGEVLGLTIKDREATPCPTCGDMAFPIYYSSPLGWFRQCLSCGYIEPFPKERKNT